MPRYAPLPIVSIDPRNEAALAQAAAQVVYNASNQTLNDFSAGNPLAVLLEGQAFAQGEFLSWANQLPQKILIEWIGPFLGAMRRLGTPATSELLVSVNPRNTSTTIPSGTSFSTNPQITSGESYEFISYSELVIPAGETQGYIPVYSKFVGSIYNVPANSITGSSTTSNIILSVTNPKPAVGGSDVETYQQVQERFFTLIRRRNPVSETDWQDFFTDLYGVGTLTSVQPNRSSKYAYNYETDYVAPNGQVSFFVLGPLGVELTEEQIKLGQNAINFSVPVENKGHLFPITLSEVQYNLTLEVDPNGSFGRNFRQSSLNFRNRIFQVLQPGQVFPATVNPTVSDVDAAFYSTFDANYRFLDPHISSSIAYNTPNLLGPQNATYTQVLAFSPTSYLLSQNDLVKVSNPNPVFYPVISNFTPYSTNKYDQTIYGNLALKQIKSLVAGSFQLGDIVYYDGSLDPLQQGLHVILENLEINNAQEVITFIAAGKISQVKTYSPWLVGNSYQYSSGGTIDPQIVEYNYQGGEFIPATPSLVPLNNRPGSLAWLVTNNFILEVATNDITGAQTNSKIGAPVTPNELTPGVSYTSGTWVSTPQIGSGPNNTIDPNYHYVDVTKGAVVKYAYVVSSFTYNPPFSTTTSNYFDSLVENGTLKEIVVFDGNPGLPIYKYKPRFKGGQYLEYKESATGVSSYYIASQFFTPDSTNAQKLLSEGKVINLTPTPDLRNQFLQDLSGGFSGQILTLSILEAGSGYVNGSYTGVPLVGADGTGSTANITVVDGSVTSAPISSGGQNFRVGDLLTVNNTSLGGSGTGLILRVSSVGQPNQNPLTTPARMFSFFKGDKTFFRNGNDVQSFTATESVTPLFDFEVYYKNGVFVKTEYSQELEGSEIPYVPYYNPLYTNFAEDTIVSEDGKNFYRVMQAFTPSPLVETWAGTLQQNSPRFEEYTGNLLRFVSSYTCEEPILPQFGQETSSIKLGVCQITIIPKGSNVPGNNQKLIYVWENTSTLSEVSELSWFTGSNFPYNPPTYGVGTLAL